MRIIKIITLTLLLITANLFQLYSQKFWLTTYEFPFGAKTGITLVDDSTLFAGFTTGVIRSLNGGYRFTESLKTRSIFTVFSTKSGSIFAGSSGKVFRSTNNGTTWDSIPLNITYPVTQIINDHQGNLFAITGTNDIENGYVGAGVFFSDNNGQTWTPRNNGLGSYLCCEQIATDKNGRIYLAVADEYATGNGGLFISDNKGLQWVHIDISFDGKDVVPNEVSITNTTGLSVSPDDSLFLSVTGVSINSEVRLNLRKNINEIQNNKLWDCYKVSGTSSWWLDRPLNNIYFAGNGDCYSSVTNSINSGGTFFKNKNTTAWKRIDYGLGLDMYGGRNIQHFAETSKGKIYMIQMLDERIYWADTSEVKTQLSDQPFVGFIIYPNLIKRGQQIKIRTSFVSSSSTIYIYNTLGKINEIKTLQNPEIVIKAPEKIGHYIVCLENDNKRYYSKLVVI